MGLYDRGYYREERTPWERMEAARDRSWIIPLIAVNVVLWLADAFTNDGMWLSNRMAITGQTLLQPWNWWKFLTYGFAHSPLQQNGVMHILGNMLVLYFFGTPVERDLGQPRFLRIYLASIVLSGAGWALVSWLTGREGLAIGASGAVSAVVMMFIFRYPQATVLLFFVIPVKAWILGVIMITQDFLRSFDPTSRVAGEAHLFGAAFGAACHVWNWKLQWLDFSWLAGWFQSRPRLRVHDPESKSRGLQEQADAILDKISREGEASLTRKERKILEQYSEQVRSRRGN